MSLDVSLYGKPETVKCSCSECGHEHTKEERECFFDANITHNLNTMAGEAGIYNALWRPDEIGIGRAEQLIEPLREGLLKLKKDPERYKKFDSDNGWGLYVDFVPWLEEYLEACIEHPRATVEADR